MARKLETSHLAAVSVLSVAIGLFLKYKFGGDWFEFAGFVTGVVGVYLVAVEHIINWPVGLVNVLIYGYVFFVSRLYADMTLQVFFFALGVHGWYQWARGGESQSELKVTRIRTNEWFIVARVWLIGTAIYYPVIRHFNGAAPFVDSSLTVASILAQILLNRKKLENWMIWITVDIIYIPLYISRGLYSTAVLYALLLALAIGGLIGWMKTYRTSAKAYMLPEVPL